jgi:hypothetical protein
MSIRDIKARARRDLHNLAKVAASFYETSAAVPRLIHVRVHTKFNQQEGDLKGTNLNFAEKEAEKPKLLFFREQVNMPPRNGLVIISADEGYRIGQAEPADGLSIKAAVVQLKPEEIAAMPNLVLPEDL